MLEHDRQIRISGNGGKTLLTTRAENYVELSFETNLATAISIMTKARDAYGIECRSGESLLDVWRRVESAIFDEFIHAIYEARNLQHDLPAVRDHASD